MKRKVILILITVLIILKIISKVFSTGHEIKYFIKDNKKQFQISEKLIKNTKNENPSYVLKIKTPKTTFNYNISNEFKGKKRIIAHIKYYKDNKYECILPLFKENKTLTDVVCKVNNKFYNYTDLVGNDKLNKFVNNISEYNYDQFKNKLDVKQKINNVKIYKNIDKISDTIILDNYKGIDIVNSKNTTTIKLFKKDIYKKYIKELNDKYYLIADYDNKYEFNKFYLIDIKKGKKETITSNQSISIDSYVQGSYKNDIYLFDKNNKIQYQINIKTKSVKPVENLDNNIKIYSVNKWDKTDIYTASKQLIKFNYYEKNSKEYLKIDKVGGQKTGYYYYYEKEDNNYNIYRSNINKKQKTYLFTTDDISRIKYKNDKIYYIDKDYLKMYSDKTGIKTILKNSELKFNKNLEFYIY